MPAEVGEIPRSSAEGRIAYRSFFDLTSGRLMGDPFVSIWNRWAHSLADRIVTCVYCQDRNEASYESRHRAAMRVDSS